VILFFNQCDSSLFFIKSVKKLFILCIFSLFSHDLNFAKFMLYVIIFITENNNFSHLEGHYKC